MRQNIELVTSAWKEGDIQGLKAIGGFEINIQWSNHKLVKAQLRSLNGGKCVLRTALPVSVTGVTQKPVRDAEGYVITFESVKGKVYSIAAL